MRHRAAQLLQSGDSPRLDLAEYQRQRSGHNADGGTLLAVQSASATTAKVYVPTGNFAYGQLSQPVTLAANTSYYLVSQEVTGGDQWYDITGVTIPSLATTPGAVYYDGSNYVLASFTSGNSYIPVNLKYSSQ